MVLANPIYKEFHENARQAANILLQMREISRPLSFSLCSACLCAVHVCVHVCVQCCPCAVHVCVQCCVLCMSVCARFCCKAIMSNSMFSGALAQTHPHAGFKESSFPICVLCFGHVATASSVILATSPGSKQTCSPAYTCVLYVCFNIAYVGHPPPFRSVAVQGPAQHTALWQASCTALRQPWGHVLWRVHWAGR